MHRHQFPDTRRDERDAGRATRRLTVHRSALVRVLRWFTVGAVGATTFAAGGMFAPRAAAAGSCETGSITPVGVGAVALSWPRERDATGYTITVSGPAWAWRSNATLVRGPYAGTVVGGLTPGATYEFTVRAEGVAEAATCLLGTGAGASGGVFTGRPADAAPTTSDHGDGIEVHFDAVVFPEASTPAARQVRVYIESAGGDGRRHGQFVTAAAADGSVVIGDLTPNEQYRFITQPLVVDATTTYGSVSAASSYRTAIVGATPARPTVTSVVADGATLTVNWSYDGPALTSQRVAVAIIADGEQYYNEVFTTGVRRSLTMHSDQIVNAPAGWDGSFNGVSGASVRGVNTVGVGPYAAPVAAATPTAPAIASLVVDADGTAGVVDLSWVPAEAVAGLTYEIAIDGPRWARGVGTVRTTAVRGTRIGGLTENVEYTFSVRATNAYHRGEAASWTGYVRGEHSCMAAPNVVRISDDAVRVMWQDDACDTTVTGYRVLVSRHDAGEHPGDPLARFGRTYGPTTFAATLSGFTAGGTYSFAVVPITVEGPTVVSPTTQQSFATAFAGGALPAAPVAVAVESRAATSATVMWEYDGPTVTSFRILVLGVDGARLGDVIAVGAGARSFVVDGLTPGASYQFRVRGVNVIGVGPWSDDTAPTD